VLPTAEPGATTMGMPQPPRAFDLMLGLPPNRASWQKDFGNLVRDKASMDLRQPAGYMFKDLPEVDEETPFGPVLIAEMDRWGIEGGLIPVSFAEDDLGAQLVREHPDRFCGSFTINPNKGVEEIRAMKRAVAELGARAVNWMPSGTDPLVAIDAAVAYPFYAACVEVGIPMFVNAGVPGPRFPMTQQDVARLDTVCYDFPELTIVTRHGCEPWTALAVKLMLKWPGLHYSTSAFAPKHYPRDIIDYANTRGADKVMYAGYFPYGLSLERIFTELPNVPLRDEVWPKFLRDNARRVLGLD
jgi:predicted TIM-barrel fold metal-dependent hydrolase